MGGAPQGAMRVASQIWQVVFASQTLQVFCLAFRKKARYVVVREPLNNNIESNKTSFTINQILPFPVKKPSTKDQRYQNTICFQNFALRKTIF
jgi:hypothetical protein